MYNHRSVFLGYLTAFLIWGAVLLFAVSCAPSGADKAKPTTGGRLSKDLARAVLGDSLPLVSDSYAIVDRNWMLAQHKIWRAEVHAQGVVRWDPRFNCIYFSQHFVSWLQLKYYLATFHASGPEATALAVGVLIYRPATRSSPAFDSHALLQVITQNGVEFFEPQTGEFVALTPDEYASRWARWL